ncbi:MAG: glutathione peroxidase, partial [Bacteroidota bacterium]
MEKTEVNGPNAHSLFKWLTKDSGDIKWNFQKFLVNKDGSLEKTIDPQTSPVDQEILDWLSI